MKPWQGLRLLGCHLAASELASLLEPRAIPGVSHHPHKLPECLLSLLRRTFYYRDRLNSLLHKESLDWVRKIHLLKVTTQLSLPLPQLSPHLLCTSQGHWKQQRLLFPRPGWLGRAMLAGGSGLLAAHQLRDALSPAPVGCPEPGAAGGSLRWGRYHGGPAPSGWPPPASCSRRS